ncbi:succinate dehydrogenase subunit C [Balneicella halophila]|uniref:Succinate dehydrogenase subunit C n=1 Tax=Balneicella halophila TaxID=1537566 RepID=A0A7L4US08_BALHA|nr:succinate dehydrogenase cytochrome b subunit [Balneicella halophila]PVX52272.1 succinate dehydrogenase subunit C [Balneicella halophila]
MSNFLSSSIGKKLIMSLSGLFLVVFLLVHLSINLLILFDSTGGLYNEAVHFMGTNPLIKVMEPVLAIGFIVHIVYATILTLQNQKATPTKYNVTQKTKTFSWASKNMYILGFAVLAFLVLHIIQFYVKMKITDTAPIVEATGGHDGYKLVTDLFTQHGTLSYVYCAVYVLAGILLGLHIRHGFWSAFQTIGWNNYTWKSRLFTLATIFAWVIAIGYSILPLYMTFFL